MTPNREQMLLKAEALKAKVSSLENAHEEAALSWNGADFWLRTVAPIATAILSLFTIASSASTAISAVLKNFTNSLIWGIVTILLSLIVSIISTLIATHKPGERGEAHERAKYDYAELKERIEYFSTFDVYKETVEDEKLEMSLRELSEKMINIGRTNITLPSRVLRKGFVSWLFNGSSNISTT